VSAGAAVAVEAVVGASVGVGGWVAVAAIVGTTTVASGVGLGAAVVVSPTGVPPTDSVAVGLASGSSSAQLGSKTIISKSIKNETRYRMNVSYPFKVTGPGGRNLRLHPPLPE